MEHVETGSRVTIVRRVLLGRSLKADIQLKSDGASKEHATISWDGAHWRIKDLSSMNGTLVNGEPLSNKLLSLAPGDLIVFGDPAESWRWLDGQGPTAFAIADDGIRVEIRGGLLLLPNDADPRASLYVRNECWELDSDGVTSQVIDGQAIDVGGFRFRLVLPTLDPAVDVTRMVKPALAKVANARMIFKVSSDEERVDVTLHAGDFSSALPSRSFHYMLLTLARAKLADQAKGIPGEDAGWLYTESLATGLLMTSEKLNVDVHRSRRLIAKLGWFEDPDFLIVRRADTAQLRLGVAHVEIVLLSPE